MWELVSWKGDQQGESRMARSTPSSLCGDPGSVFNTLVKHRASNHPHCFPFPFLWLFCPS